MLIYNLYLLLMASLAIFYEVGRKQEKYKLSICIVGGLGLFLISALRSADVGKDLQNYLPAFDVCASQAWGGGGLLRYEPGYLILCKSISLISTSHQFFIASISFLTLAGPIYFIYRNSKNPAVSYFLYVAMTFFAFSMSGLRQSIATSVILCGYHFLSNRNVLKFFGVVFLAGTFHFTALIYIIAYPVTKLEIRQRTVFLYFALIFFLFLVKKQLLSFVVGNFASQYSETLNSSDSFTYMLTMFLVLMAGLTVHKKVISINPKNAVLYNLIFLAILFQLLGTESSNIVRIAELFYMAVLVFIPEVISSVRKKNHRLLLYIAVMFVTAVQFIYIFPGGGYGVTPYKIY